ncbi:site-specific integrase [uncultured Polaribacter sp.]|uniref:tyrosine-type recombinase/integrase n=1 Tax=uncultured Polaribacter sp. TaxID=174711 RepID=UPI002612F64A|nr:site-specific integrase [uncultured Polaribacter sp.]
MKTAKVKVRFKILKSGSMKSTYLDIYPAIIHPISGKVTRREYLRMYVYTKPKNEVEKIHNKNVIHRANIICNERQNQIYNNDFGFLASELDNKCFLEYFESLARKRGRSSSSQAKWLIVLKYLKEFSSEIKMKDLTIPFIHRFRDFLLTRKHFKIKDQTISQNSASSYFSKITFSIKCAYKDGIIRQNIAPKIERIKAIDVKKEFLTTEEATKLKNTPSKDNVHKRACLFMMYTGLRVSDIINLKWSEIEHSKELGHYIRFQHQKTKNQQTLPFSEDAYQLLPKKGEGNVGVFYNFSKKYSLLKAWAKNAGITKNIGYHTFRHSYATMLLSNDVSIFTVQQMLNHRSISNTMRYVNLLNDKKITAANAIKF